MCVLNKQQGSFAITITAHCMSALSTTSELPNTGLPLLLEISGIATAMHWLKTLPALTTTSYSILVGGMMLSRWKLPRLSGCRGGTKIDPTKGLGMPNLNRGGNRIVESEPATGKSRNQGTCLGTKPGALKNALTKAIDTLPAHLKGSLTWDQGSEMAGHKAFSIATDCPVLFCNPGSPWQRGSNENTNGLLRQYFPKGTNLSVYSEEDREFVAMELNRRPRKTLDYDTPAERITRLLESTET